MSSLPGLVAQLLTPDGVQPVRFIAAAPASGGKIDVRNAEPFEMGPGDVLQFPHGLEVDGAASDGTLTLKAGDSFTITYEQAADWIGGLRPSDGD
jgi:hypothetical protein